MPLYRHLGQLIFYAHVPKCAGTSVGEYLNVRFGQPAFQDRKFLREPAEHPWTKSSPQHVTVDAFNRLFPENFVDHTFAFVRHPVQRIASAYVFQKYGQKRIQRFVSFSQWLKSLPSSIEKQPFRYDGHALPQSEFVPQDAKVFKLENGLDQLVSYLDDMFGATDAVSEFGHKQKAKKSIEVTARDEEKIREIYAVDFQRFGYD